MQDAHFEVRFQVYENMLQTTRENFQKLDSFHLGINDKREAIDQLENKMNFIRGEIFRSINEAIKSVSWNSKKMLQFVGKS